jgi:hypothetical protein
MHLFVTLLVWGAFLLGMRWVLGFGLDAEEIERTRLGGMTGQYFIYPYLRPVGIISMVVGGAGVAVMPICPWRAEGYAVPRAPIGARAGHPARG